MTARGPLEPPTADLVAAVLAVIPPDCDRDTWLDVGMAVKASGLSNDVAFALWDGWSAKAESYRERDARDTWRSFKASGPVTVATLFHIGKKYGFRVPRKGRRAAPPDAEAQRAAAELQAKRQAEREAEAAALAQRHAAAAERSRNLWDKAKQRPPRGGAAYLVRKGVKGYGVRFLPGGEVLVPMRDEAGELWSVQRLLPKALPAGDDGQAGTDKLYGPPKATRDEQLSSRKTGLMHLIGKIEHAPVLLLGEGYATCASLHEATGRPVAVCFDAGNLVHVASALRKLHPQLRVLVCGDDDHPTEARTGKNPGRVKAAAAVAAAGHSAAAVFPVFATGTADRGKDWNDLHTCGPGGGLAEVARQVEAACVELLKHPPGSPPSTSETADAPPGQDHAQAPPTSGTGDVPLAGRAQAFHVDDAGVWFTPRDKSGNSLAPRWICSSLEVIARTRGDDGNGWGYLIVFRDPDGNVKKWAMPSSMLAGVSAEWAAQLRDMGLTMAAGAEARNLLAEYIDTRRPVDRVVSVDRVGWHPGGVYVLPSGSIGEADGRPRYVFQSDAGMEDTFRRNGTLKQWRDAVAAKALHNSRLVFALASAFGGPLLHPAGAESTIFHFRGTSSMGKTTVLRGAASVWGPPTFMQTWRNTDNALEGTAAQHCDCTLILDEFGQVESRVAGEVAYMLCNQQEKGRSTRNGFNRKRRNWRVIVVSSGEVSLADHMAEAGKRVQAGQEVRMVDVPLDAGAGMGGLEELHGHERAAELADAITADAARFYGTAGRAWLEWLCSHHDKLPARVAELLERNRAAMVPEAASEQVRRVGSRFALVAAAGELATEARITGWPAGHAEWAARQCFNAWLSARGHLDNGEEVAMLRQVRAFIEKNGDALFTWLQRSSDDHRPSTPLRAGFKRWVDAEGKPLKMDAATDYTERYTAGRAVDGAVTEYLVLAEAFRRDVCKGFDATAVANVLRHRGHLKHEADRLTMKHRLPGIGHASVYHVLPSILADDGGSR
jgi:putative DNA primase/helicase